MLAAQPVEIVETKPVVRRQQLRELVPLADATPHRTEQRGEFPTLAARRAATGFVPPLHRGLPAAKITPNAALAWGPCAVSSSVSGINTGACLFPSIHAPIALFHQRDYGARRNRARQEAALGRPLTCGGRIHFRRLPLIPGWRVIPETGQRSASISLRPSRRNRPMARARGAVHEVHPARRSPAYTLSAP